MYCYSGTIAPSAVLPLGHLGAIKCLPILVKVPAMGQLSGLKRMVKGLAQKGCTLQGCVREPLQSSEVCSAAVLNVYPPVSFQVRIADLGSIFGAHRLNLPQPAYGSHPPAGDQGHPPADSTVAFHQIASFQKMMRLMWHGRKPLGPSFWLTESIENDEESDDLRGQSGDEGGRTLDFWVTSTVSGEVDLLQSKLEQVQYSCKKIHFCCGGVFN